MQKCGYCDFLSAAGSGEEKENYVQALEKEIRSYGDFAKGYRVSTVFVGGEPLPVWKQIRQSGYLGRSGIPLK